MIKQDFQPSSSDESKYLVKTKDSENAKDKQLHSDNNIPLSVLVIGTEADLFRAGSAAASRALAYGKHFREVHIICFTRRRQKLGPIQISESVHVYPTNSRFALFWGLNALKIARRLDIPDVITTQDPFECGLLGLIISWQLRRRLHVQVHTDFTSKAFVRHSFVNWIRQKIAWFVLKRAARVRVILERTALDIRARGVTAPVSVLPIFVDSNRLASLPRVKHPRWKLNMLCAGRFEKEKRFELAIAALSVARSKGHDVGLTMVGEGRERRKYYRYAQRLRVADRLEMVGWHNDLGKYYSETDIVLVPSRYEGYGLVIVEALSAGIPVLATDVGVAREAGAIITTAKNFSAAVLEWIESGPRTAHLTAQPYKDLNDYVEKYCADVAATGTAVV